MKARYFKGRALWTTSAVLAVSLVSIACGSADEQGPFAEGSDGEEGATGPVVGSDAIHIVAARGISISHIEANQGVQVDVSRGGKWVEIEARNSILLDRRDTYFRVHYSVDESSRPATKSRNRRAPSIDEGPVSSRTM